MNTVYLRVATFCINGTYETESSYIDGHTKQIDEKGYLLAHYKHVANIWIKGSTTIQIVKVKVDKLPYM